MRTSRRKPGEKMYHRVTSFPEPVRVVEPDGPLQKWFDALSDEDHKKLVEACVAAWRRPRLRVVK
jgi:hypothetical protein